MQQQTHQLGRDGLIAALASVITQASEFLSGRKPDEMNAERQAAAWCKQLRGIPADKLQACLEIWTESGPRQSLRAIDLREAWTLVQRNEPVTQARTIYRDGVALYTCKICQDVGYVSVWQHGRRCEYQSGSEIKQGPRALGWSKTQRPCGCVSTPMVQRMAYLSSLEYTRHVMLNEYARTVDLIEHGAPSAHWQQVANSYKSQVENAEAA